MSHDGRRFRLFGLAAVIESYALLLLGSCGGGSTVQAPPPNPVPAIQSISPTSAAAGTSGFTLAVNGSNFLASSVVSWNGVVKQTTFVSLTQLTTPISATDLAAQGTVQVGVRNPAPGGGQSTASFNVSAPTAPLVTSVSPSTAIVGGAAFMLAVYGSNFVQISVVQWNGSSRPTTYVSNAELTASIPATDISSAVGNQPVSVSTPGVGNSNTVPILVEYPLPSINLLSPSQVPLGSGAFTLTVSGSNFVNGATVYWNSVGRVTQLVSPTQLTASILTSDIAITAGAYVLVTVQNPSPSAGVSNVEKFAIENPAPVISSITPSSAPAGTHFTIAVSGSGFIPGATVQLGGQSLTTPYNSSSSVSAVVPSASVGNLSLSVLNPAPTAGPSNVLLFDSTPVGPGGQFVAASVDPSGNIQDLLLGGSLSSTGRYYVFNGYLRDTCLTAFSGCVPSTVAYGPNTNLRVNATGVSTNGRYISSQVIGGVISREGDLEFSDSCLGAPAGCVPTTSTLLPSSLYPATSMTPDGRYIVNGVGGAFSNVLPVQIFDTCTGAPPGCTQTSISVTNSAVPSLLGWPLSADGRFIPYVYGQAASNVSQITLHDSCLGAAPGCVPTDEVMSDSSISCSGPYLSGDAKYVSYACGGGLYLQNTCANVSSGCTSTPQRLTLPEAVGVGFTAVSGGGRFLFFEATNSAVLSGQTVVYVYDSCNGVSSSCTPRTAPVCLGIEGSIANADCHLEGISADGQYVVIYTEATNLSALPVGVSTVSYIWRNPVF